MTLRDEKKAGASDWLHAKSEAAPKVEKAILYTRREWPFSLI